MADIKIPFGWHLTQGRFTDPASVPKGLDCGCVCHKCRKTLQAVHPRKGRRKYFRHDKRSGCTGGQESMWHGLAEQILKENDWVKLPEGGIFHYGNPEVEIRRHGKQPDIYLTNSETGKTLIVEILFSHETDNSTLQVYQRHGEQVMEIDISAVAKMLPFEDEFKQFVLSDAPRQYLVPSPEQAPDFIAEESIPALAPPINRYSAPGPSMLRQFWEWFKENWATIFIVILVLLGTIWIWKRTKAQVG